MNCGIIIVSFELGQFSGYLRIEDDEIYLRTIF